jgi:hypothetical protein
VPIPAALRSRRILRLTACRTACNIRGRGPICAADSRAEPGGIMLFEIWVSVALLGLWSCVGVIYNNSRKASRQLDDAVRLLAEIASKK